MDGLKQLTEHMLFDKGATGGGIRAGASFTAEVLDQVEEEFTRMFRVDDIAPDDPCGAARLLRLLLEEQGPCSPSAAWVLSSSGIRDRWNSVFACQRSAEVADWLAPRLLTPVLDVLGGDCTVAAALRDRLVAYGVPVDPPPVSATERPEDYLVDRSASPVPFYPYGHADLSSVPARSLVVCTVLHHETDPVGLLEEIASLDAARWLVVENCILAEYQEPFHNFMDLFFNNCLNKFGIACTAQHRTPDGWRSLLSRYGTVMAEEQRAVPGIPFPYTLYEVHR